MRFGQWAAAAAALICAGQADAARYYGFQLVSAFETTGVTVYPNSGGYFYPVGHTDTLTFVFDTANATPIFAGGPYYFSSGAVSPNPTYGQYGVMLEYYPSASNALLTTVNSPGGPKFNTNFSFADVKFGDSFQPLNLSNYDFFYNIVDSRGNINLSAKPGRIISASAFTTDIAPSSLGLTDNLVVTYLPEPATWAMSIFGFGLAGASLRRRRSALRPAIA